jgi:hypothetical protein
MFPKKIRWEYPVWTKFKVRARLSQKYHLIWSYIWKPKWKPYLYSYVDTVKVLL